MPKQVAATDAKNNFGGLLDDVAALGRVDVMKHGRLVAVVFSPRAFDAELRSRAGKSDAQWGKTHMIPPELARTARMTHIPRGFDDED